MTGQFAMTYSAAWIRERFAAGCRREAEVSEPGVTATAQALTRAAVLVPLVQRETGITVLLTQRTVHLRDHAGQVSFPGGRCEDADASPIDTALREAHEEVGIDRAQVEVLGTLPEYRTGTGFCITPVVGLVRPPLSLRLDDFEVAETFETPLGFLLDPLNHRRHKIEHGGQVREYWAMPWQGYHIWGATAGMVVSLYRFLLPSGSP